MLCECSSLRFDMARLLSVLVFFACIFGSHSTPFEDNDEIPGWKGSLASLEMKLNKFIDSHAQVLKENRELRSQAVENKMKTDELIQGLQKQNRELTIRLDNLEKTAMDCEKFCAQNQHSNGEDKMNDALVLEIQSLKRQNDETKFELNGLQNKLELLQQNSDRCLVDLQQLSSTVRKNDDTSVWDTKNPLESAIPNKDGIENYLSATQNQKRIIPAMAAPTDEIAFYAYLSTSTAANLPTHHILKYDVVKVNKGQGYRQDDGIFTVPSSGVYVFVWTMSVQVPGWASLEIVVNGQVLGSAFANDNADDWDFATGIALAEAHTGDHVYIRMYKTGRGIIYSAAWGRTSFSGWKLL